MIPTVQMLAIVIISGCSVRLYNSKYTTRVFCFVLFLFFNSLIYLYFYNNE